MRNKKISFLACLLLGLLICGCRCHPESHYYSNQSDVIPYSLGSTFQMLDSAGRVIQFEDTLYSDQLAADVNPTCKCCDESTAQVIRTAFKSDSASFSLGFSEVALGESGGTARPDGFSITVDGNTFYGDVTGNVIAASSNTTVTAHSTLLVGNQSYADVYEMANGLTLPYLGANKVWYNRTEGLLKIAFTDSTFLVIDN